MLFSGCQFKPKDQLPIETKENKVLNQSSKQMENIEIRVRNLENENLLIRQQLIDLKRFFGWDLKKPKENNFGKLLVKINDKTLIIEADTKELIFYY